MATRTEINNMIVLARSITNYQLKSHNDFTRMALLLKKYNQDIVEESLNLLKDKELPKFSSTNSFFNYMEKVCQNVILKSNSSNIPLQGLVKRV